MALDKLLIGARVREIRENKIGESRSDFAKRCNLTERHIGQIERGEFTISIYTLDKISSSTGFDTDYLLYGKIENNKSKIRKALDTLISRADKEELIMYYKCITTIKSYVRKREKK